MNKFTTAFIFVIGIAGTQAARAEGFSPWTEARAPQTADVTEVAATPRFAGFAPWLQPGGNRPVPQQDTAPPVAISSSGFMPWVDRRA